MAERPLEIVWMTVIWSCQKSACAATSRCSCRNASRPCTPSCRCHQCENTDVGGKIVTEEDSEGDDWVGLYHSSILQKVDVLVFAMLLVKLPFNMLTFTMEKSLRYHQSAGQKGKDGNELTINQVKKLEDPSQASKCSSNPDSLFERVWLFVRCSVGWWHLSIWYHCVSRHIQVRFSHSSAMENYYQ